MGTLTEKLDYQPAINDLLSRISKVAWFSATGTSESKDECTNSLNQYLSALSIAKFPVYWAKSWMEAGELAYSMDVDSSLMLIEENLRKEALEKIRVQKREPLLKEALAQLTLSAYDHIRAPLVDEETGRVASASATMLLSAALTWIMIEDQPGNETNPFLFKFKIYELGHWPIGMRNGSFVIF
jgi:hypothetical protein